MQSRAAHPAEWSTRGRGTPIPVAPAGLKVRVLRLRPGKCTLLIVIDVHFDQFGEARSSLFGPAELFERDALAIKRLPVLRVVPATSLP